MVANFGGNAFACLLSPLARCEVLMIRSLYKPANIQKEGNIRKKQKGPMRARKCPPRRVIQ